MEILHPNWPSLAPLFHYHVTRFINFGADSQGFLDLDQAILTLINQGICRFDLHPESYTTSGVTVKPTSQAFSDALTRRIQRQGLLFRYRPLVGPSRAALIREQIRKGYPVVIGIKLPHGYPNAFLDKKMEWQDPNTPPLSSSGHCLLVLGYADSRQALRIQDSRGAAMFDGGCWWMGYRVADSAAMQAAYSLF